MSLFFRLPSISSLLFIALIFQSMASFAQTNEPFPLGGTLSEQVVGDPFIPYKISFDGVHVVYTASATNDGNLDLYSVPITGGQTTRISRVGDSSFFFNYQISPDSSTVVYTSGNSNGLISVPINGGTNIRIDSDEKQFDSILYRISPITNRVVYTSSFDTLYSAPMRGGQIEGLTNFDFNNGDINSFIISPNGEYVVSSTFDLDDATKSYIFSVPIAGGDVITLSADRPDFEFLQRIVITPDSERVVYTAFLSDSPAFKTGLFSVPIQGGDVIELSPEPTGNDGGVGGFDITIDSQHVIYTFSDTDWTGFNNDVSVDITPIDVRSPSALFSSGTDDCGYVLSNNNEFLIRCVESAISNGLDFYRIQASDAQEIKLNFSLPVSLNDDRVSFRLTQDDQFIVINTSPVFGPFEEADLYTAEINGNTIRQIENFSPSCFGSSNEVSMDSQHIYYCNDNNGLSVSTIDATNDKMISNQGIDNFRVYSFDVASGGDYAVFFAGTVPTGSLYDFNLYSVELEDMPFKDDGLCFPVKAVNGAVAVICL